jgi:hypothetical protein
MTESSSDPASSPPALATIAVDTEELDKLLLVNVGIAECVVRSRRQNRVTRLNSQLSSSHDVDGSTASRARDRRWPLDRA